MQRYWKFLSVLPGAVLAVCVAMDWMPFSQAKELEVALAALVTVLGPLLSPANRQKQPGDLL